MIAVAEWNFIMSIELCAEAIPQTPNKTAQIVLKILIVSISLSSPRYVSRSAHK